MPRERRPPRSLAGAEAPLLLRLIYRVVPKGMADVILPPNASLSRQVCPANTGFLCALHEVPRNAFKAVVSAPHAMRCR